MTDPQPSCSEIASKIAFESSAKHGYEEAGLRGWQEEQIKEALQAKQKTIEELQAKLESCEMLTGSTMGNICCQYHRAEALEKTIESLRAEVGGFRTWSMASFGTTHPEMTHDPKPTYTELEAQLSRLKAEVERLGNLVVMEGEPGQERTWKDEALSLITMTEEQQAQLSRLKEILKGRDGALEKIANLEWPHLGVVDIAQQALSKTWEEGE